MRRSKRKGLESYVGMGAISTHQRHQSDVTADARFCSAPLRALPRDGGGGINNLYLGHLVGGGKAKGIVKGSISVLQADADQSRYLVGVVAAEPSTPLSKIVRNVREGRSKWEFESGQRNAGQVAHCGMVEEVKGKHRA